MVRAAVLLLPMLFMGLAASVRGQNILVVVLDDVGVDKVGVYGEHVEAGPTPVLDQLAAEGVLFRNAWALPVCSPSRASALTGRFPFRHGIGFGVTWTSQTGFVLGDDERTLPEALSELGYRTAVVGKWHLANQGVRPDPYLQPIAFGFERHLGAIDNFTDYYAWLRNDASVAGATQQLWGRYATTQAVDDALTIIDDWGPETPWFLWLAFNAPHLPLHAPPSELHTQGDLSEASPAVVYRAMLEALDTELGRLLESIDPDVLAQTWIFVFGDNGTTGEVALPPFGINFNTKASVLEGGVNVPLLVRGPGVVPAECDHLVSSVDLFATILDLVRSPAPFQTSVAGTTPDGSSIVLPPGAPVLDSTSFAAVLRDPASPPARSWVYTQRFYANGFGPWGEWREAIRDERFKLVRRGGPELREWLDEVDFYDLRNDPFEVANLLAAPLDPLQQARFEQLSAIADDLRAER